MSYKHNFVCSGCGTEFDDVPMCECGSPDPDAGTPWAQHLGAATPPATSGCTGSSEGRVIPENPDPYPGFNFWRDVVGDDLVVGGALYDANEWQHDGEGGVERRANTWDDHLELEEGFQPDFDRTAGPGARVKLGEDSEVSEHARIGDDITIEADAVISLGAAVRPRARVRRGAVVGKYTVIEVDAEVGTDAHVGDFTTVMAGAHVGAEAYVGNHCTIGPGARVHPGEVILDGSEVYATPRSLGAENTTGPSSVTSHRRRLCEGSNRTRASVSAVSSGDAVGQTLWRMAKAKTHANLRSATTRAMRRGSHSMLRILGRTAPKIHSWGLHLEALAAIRDDRDRQRWDVPARTSN